MKRFYKGMIFHNTAMPCDVEVLEANEFDNTLKVRLLSKVPWEETWNLKHAQVGWKQGVYRDIDGV